MAEEPDKVLFFTGLTKLNYDPVRVLEESAKTPLTDVVVIGWRDDGEGNFFFHSSASDGAQVLWLLEAAKLELMRAGDAPPAYPKKPA